MGTADERSGASSNNNSTREKTESVFISCETAYLLGDGWGQAIGNDEHPVLGGQKVYYG